MTQPIHSKPPETSSQPPEARKSTWYQTGVEILSGGAAGAVGTYSITPLMYFKMHMQEKARNPQNSPKLNKNPAAWFKGGGPLAAWMFPQSAFAFVMTEWMRRKLSNQGERELSPGEKLACSAATGGLLTVFVNPQELIWTQQKVAEDSRQKMIEQQKLDPKSVPTKSAMMISQEIWKKHGIRGFYRSAPETAGREVVSNCVLTYLAAEYPILAPVLGAAISQPLDVRKTHKQADFTYKAPIGELIKTKAFSGLIPRIGIYLVFMNVAPRVKNQCEQWMLPDQKPRKKE